MKSLMIASDHGGWKLKQAIKARFPHIQWVDLGPISSDQSVDYPDYADQLCSKINQNLDEPQGILVCGSGQGMSLRANKYPQVRAALVWNLESAELSRKHNNANILCIGERLVPQDLALQSIEKFLETPFEGGRHLQRVQKIHQSLLVESPKAPFIAK